MPTKRYSLRPGEPPRLEIRGTQWGRWWKDLTVRLDGAEVGTVATGKELQAGAGLGHGPGSAGAPRRAMRLRHRGYEHCPGAAGRGSPLGSNASIWSGLR